MIPFYLKYLTFSAILSRKGTISWALFKMITPSSRLFCKTSQILFPAITIIFIILVRIPCPLGNINSHYFEQ